MSKIGRNDPCPCGSGRKYKQCCDSPGAAAAKLESTVEPKPGIEPVTTATLFRDALAHHQAGRFAAAEPLYQRILETEPGQPDVLHLLGVIAYQTRRHEAAIKLIRRAIEINPSNAMFYSNLANAQQELGQFESAIVNYHQAIRLKPDYAQAHHNLGNAFMAQQAFESAVLSYRQALALQPSDVPAYQHLGRALFDLGRFDEALGSYRQALAYRPNDAELHNQLGRVLTKLGQTPQAIECFRQAIVLRPAYVEAHNNLGFVLQEQGSPAAAITHFEHALQFEPAYALARLNLGNTLLQQGQTDAAISCYRQVLSLQPDHADAHNNLGQALAHQGDLPAAYAHLRTAIQLKPEFDAAYSNLLFHLNYDAQLTPARYLQEARAFDTRLQARAQPYSNWTVERILPAGKKLRVGLVSGDLGQHPVGYFLESVLTSLKQLDRLQIEWIAYPTKLKDDALTARIKPCFTEWHSLLGLSDAAAASKIHDDGIQILIDLAGHTADNRLPVMARKPAPVQVAWLGYFASTGVAAIDYILADDQVLPVGEESHFVETPWRLPDCYLCFTAPRDPIAVNRLPLLSNGYVTFGCFNKLNKMNDAVVALWARVLHAVPGSRLVLKAKELTDVSARDLTQARFAAWGIAPQRIVMEGFSVRASYLENYHRVDIALDPFPYPGGTTTVEALWMGVPVLSRRGSRFLSHAGESLLKTAGLPEWIAADDEDYVRRAQAYAADVTSLAELRAGLRDQLLASPLCDAPRFAANLGQALNGMWRRYVDSAAALAVESSHE